MTCRAIANRMAETAGGQAGWGPTRRGMALRDAVVAVPMPSPPSSRPESNKGEQRRALGRRRRRGRRRAEFDQGGRRRDACGLQPAQRPQRHRHVVARARGACGKPPDLPDMVVAWRGRGLANRVLGEREQRTCENCTKTQTMPGVGLTPVIQEEYETKLRCCRSWSGARPTTPRISTRPAAARCRSPAA